MVNSQILHMYSSTSQTTLYTLYDVFNLVSCIGTISLYIQLLLKHAFIYNAHFTYLLTAVHHHGDLESELDDALSRNRDLENISPPLRAKYVHYLVSVSAQMDLHEQKLRWNCTCNHLRQARKLFSIGHNFCSIFPISIIRTCNNYCDFLKAQSQLFLSVCFAHNFRSDPNLAFSPLITHAFSQKQTQ